MKSVEQLTTPSHVVVVEQHGEVMQTLELPLGVPFNELEFSPNVCGDIENNIADERCP